MKQLKITVDLPPDFVKHAQKWYDETAMAAEALTDEQAALCYMMQEWYSYDCFNGPQAENLKITIKNA